MHFEHRVHAIAGGSEVAHRVWFSGPLAFLFGPSVARQVSQGLPRTMRSLKAYAEQRHEQAAASPA
jgi:glycerol-3-phosphate dehydrogenase